MGDRKREEVIAFREILLDLENKNGKENHSEEDLRSRIDYLFETGVITTEAMNFMRAVPLRIPGSSSTRPRASVPAR